MRVVRCHDGADRHYVAVGCGSFAAVEPSSQSARNHSMCNVSPPTLLPFAFLHSLLLTLPFPCSCYCPSLGAGRSDMNTHKAFEATD